MISYHYLSIALRAHDEETCNNIKTGSTLVLISSNKSLFIVINIGYGV